MIVKLKQKYSEPTPKKWRKLGDALLAVGTTITGYAVIEDFAKWISLTALAITIAGKFLTNFFSEEKYGTI